MSSMNIYVALDWMESIGMMNSNTLVSRVCTVRILSSMGISLSILTLACTQSTSTSTSTVVWVTIDYIIYLEDEMLLDCEGAQEEILLLNIACNHIHHHHHLPIGSEIISVSCLKGQSNKIFDRQFFFIIRTSLAWATDQWVQIFSIMIPRGDFLIFSHLKSCWTVPLALVSRSKNLSLFLPSPCYLQRL